MRYLRGGAGRPGCRARWSPSANGEQVIAGGRARRPDRRPGRRASSPRGRACAASRRRTPSWPARGRSASSRRQAVVFEDALAGVAAGRAGDFGYVVGVDRVGQADGLAEHGADVVVQDLAELLDQP